MLRETDDDCREKLMKEHVAGTHPLVSSLPARIQFLSKVSQVIVVVKVTQRNKVLKDKNICDDQIIKQMQGTHSRWNDFSKSALEELTALCTAGL